MKRRQNSKIKFKLLKYLLTFYKNLKQNTYSHQYCVGTNQQKKIKNFFKNRITPTPTNLWVDELLIRLKINCCKSIAVEAAKSIVVF